MNPVDLQHFSKMTQILVPSSDEALKECEQTLSALSTLPHLTSDNFLIKGAESLYLRLKRDGVWLSAASPVRTLEKLTFDEKFCLALMQTKRFSYHQIAQVMKVSSPEMSEMLVMDASVVEKLLWSARCKLSYQQALQFMALKALPLKRNCPDLTSDFVADHPWTQKLVDDELSQKELHFLSAHILHCDHCRRCVEVTRQLIFKADQLVQGELGDGVHFREQLRPALKKISENRRRLIAKDPTFFEAVGSFLKSFF